MNDYGIPTAKEFCDTKIEFENSLFDEFMKKIGNKLQTVLKEGGEFPIEIEIDFDTPKPVLNRIATYLNSRGYKTTYREFRAENDEYIVVTLTAKPTRRG